MVSSRKGIESAHSVTGSMIGRDVLPSVNLTADRCKGQSGRKDKSGNEFYWKRDHSFVRDGYLVQKVDKEEISQM